jgi:PleD family two-component response regulator
MVVAATECRRRLVDILLQAGYFVAEAVSGEDVLRMLSSVEPDLILMSIVLPDTNGLELAEKLKGTLKSNSPPIILLGALLPIGISDEPLVSLVSGYLNVDVSPHDLLSTVREMLATTKT